MAITRKASVGWSRDVDDLREVMRRLCSPKEQADILERGVKAACEPILSAAKMFAQRSEQTGALRDSLTIKTVKYSNRGKATAVGLVGPDREYRVNGKKAGKLATLFAATKGQARRPANYAHLVEYGHRIAKGGTLTRKNGRGSKGTGTEGGFVPAKPFLRPAVITTRTQQHAAFEKAVGDALDRALRKHNKKAGTRVRYKKAA
jgi:hypothetical protein